MPYPLKYADMLVIRLNSREQTSYLELAARTDNGAETLIVGYPNISRGKSEFLLPLASLGKIVEWDRKNGYEKFITSARVEGGSSGSPVLNSDSKVVGVAVGHRYDFGDRAFTRAISTSFLNDFLSHSYSSYVHKPSTCVRKRSYS